MKIPTKPAWGGKTRISNADISRIENAVYFES